MSDDIYAHAQPEDEPIDFGRFDILSSDEASTYQSELAANPFAHPGGLNWELVDDPGVGPVHKPINGVRVNGLDITRWVERGGISITTDAHEATRVHVTFLAASVRTVSE